MIAEQLGSNAHEKRSTSATRPSASPVELSSVAFVPPLLLSASPSPEELPEESIAGPELSPDVSRSSPPVDPRPIPAVSLATPDPPPVDSSDDPDPSASDVVATSVLPDALDPLLPPEATEVDDEVVVPLVSVSSDEDVQLHSMESRIA